MAAIDPGVARADLYERAARLSVRLLAFVAYAACVLLALLAVRPILPTGNDSAVVLPVEPPALTYETVPGDTLESVATGQGLSLAGLLVLNPDASSVTLKPGTKLRIG